MRNPIDFRIKSSPSLLSIIDSRIDSKFFSLDSSSVTQPSKHFSVESKWPSRSFHSEPSMEDLNRFVSICSFIFFLIRVLGFVKA
ncbi:hypothetical protein LOK49_LG04G01389 [Camellia lanceoleosa]|uniref:Uncharacterized protein n=1 Tax=Camellia lanceoleosa TaxID=1840588 RepID=A0ACC0I3D4_9ERIC|nr:hypothetical protein LOK49_LG04G01389 [Camellia lanceoleosa]